MRLIAADIGGTFTDLASTNADGVFGTAKTLTTPDDHAQGILDGLDQLGPDLSGTEFFLHGSTIAINTVLQRAGATTALITTEGFRDVYEIGRGNRPEPYNLFFNKPVPLVPRRLRGEVRERMRADGSVRTPLDTAGAVALIHRLRAAGVESVAVCLLHSYANPEHEVQVGQLIKQEWPEAYVTLSHEIMREYREYERSSTTVLNAYVGPVVSRYLSSLETQLAARGFRGRMLIMQSNGGTMSVEHARRSPVRMMESGPVAGVIGAAALSGQLGMSRLISFDMGGTTAKASLVKDGQVDIADGYFIGGHSTGHPMNLPVVNIVEVGAGGGSIAWLDAAGALKVGPVSAGAAPGPACYGLGGDRPTVTDANLVLGRLGGRRFLGGTMPLDLAAAQEAIRRQVAEPLGMDLLTAARGIVTIADAQMSLAVRAVSVEKGEDPREFALVATGGAGPLHAVSIARELNIGTVVIPVLPGQFSAKGMLSAAIRHDLTRTLIGPFTPDSTTQYAAALAALADEAHARLREDTEVADGAEVAHWIELRYKGQEFTIAVPVPAEGLSAAAFPIVRERFDALHEQLYGHKAPEERVEAVGVRTAISVTVTPDGVAVGPPPGTAGAGGLPEPIEIRPVVLADAAATPVDCPVYARASLAPGVTITGPAIVEEETSSVVTYPGDTVTVAPDHSLIVTVGASR